MTTRAQRSARRRAAWHQGRVDNAETEKGRLWAACGWLVSESWRLGRVGDATERVLTLVHEIREEDADDCHAA
jgi:hypothetical protein